MHLKRLELQGFKSFLERTIISFDPGITGVVGPNGCGKSNIVDAILWVMGEQSAKHLRGEQMSDVIFNGTDTKAPTSFAEVSLIMEKQNLVLPAHLAGLDRGEELEVTRRLYRDGTAEYLLNKTQVRLRDIHELFMDTGVGRRTYSIIEQGQIDRMINVKPEERRYIFEEVAGITKYRTKRKEAERKLEATKQNLDRVQDVLNELEKQLRSLKIQAGRAKKYKEIKLEIETADLYLLGRSLYDLRQGISDLLTDKEKWSDLRSQQEAEFSEADAKLTRLEVERLDLEKILTDLDQRERDLSLWIQKLENQNQIFVEQQKHFVTLISDIEAQRADLQKALETLNTDLEKIYIERDLGKTAFESIEIEMSQTEVQIAELHKKKKQTLTLKEEAQDELMALKQRMIQMEHSEQSAIQKQSEISFEQKTLHEDLSAIVEALEIKKQDLVQADEKIKVNSERGKQLEGQASEVVSECELTSLKLSEMEELLFATREKFHRHHSRLESLEELQRNHEGYSPSAKEVLDQLGSENTSAIPLADVISPEPAFEEMFERILGELLHTLLVPSIDEAKHLSQLISEKDLEKVGLLILNELPQHLPNSQMTPESHEGLSPLLDRVRIEPGYEKAASWFLSGIYLCENGQSIFDCRDKDPMLAYISKDGKNLSYSNPTLSFGKLPKQTGIFARRREIEELKTLCGRLQLEVDAKVLERHNLLEQLEAQEKLQASLKDKLSSVHIEAVTYRKEKESIQQDLDRTDTEYSELLLESEQKAKTLETLNEQILNYQKETASCESKIDAKSTSLRSHTLALEEVQQEMEHSLSTLNDLRVERSKIEERLLAAEDKLKKALQECSNHRQKIESLNHRQGEIQSQIEKSKMEEASNKEKCAASTIERNELLIKISDLRTTFAELTTELNSVRELRESLRVQREEILSNLQNTELALKEQESALDYQRNLSLERYQKEALMLSQEITPDLEKMPLFTADLKMDFGFLSKDEKETLLKEHLETLRKKVERYGEVNLTAIQEYDEVESRFTFLGTQKEDLEKSIQILETAIKRIDETSQNRFFETFHGVNKKFKEVFPILFSGGKAELALTNPENILETGVDILAQPPGKRLQSISLLSGGEKALTAVSLILAIFARKPSPFCLLDEVDAPLDDANVSRYNSVVKHMAKKSQFILVTHNKKTMEIADSLYGVTMERSGISKMTSVQMH